MSLAHNASRRSFMMSYEWRHAFTRIQIEYIEMPDLKLTLAQIRRLCDLPEELCEPAVAALLHVGFLWRTHDGRFVRRALGRAGREITESDVDPALVFLALETPPLRTHQ
jgi:hypothetical protein